VATRSRTLPRSYAHIPRTILWLVPGGELEVNGSAVRVDPFYLGKWPVTNEQFEAFDADHERSPLSPGDRDLAVGVSWRQADAYCRWYARVSRKPMRLPSESEWLYACRGGSAEPAGSGTAAPEAVDASCWHAGNSCGLVQPPERKAGNGFGLHGMLGSVWEWVAAEPGADDDAPRVLRGGSFRTKPPELHPSLVRREPPDYRASDVGFRVARSFRLAPGWR